MRERIRITDKGIKNMKINKRDAISFLESFIPIINRIDIITEITDTEKTHKDSYENMFFGKSSTDFIISSFAGT